jgi:hypothetical protein
MTADADSVLIILLPFYGYQCDRQNSPVTGISKSRDPLIHSTYSFCCIDFGPWYKKLGTQSKNRLLLIY